MKKFGGPWFWANREALLHFLPHSFGKRGKTASVPSRSYSTRPGLEARYKERRVE